jgi:hypothetical protein
MLMHEDMCSSNGHLWKEEIGMWRLHGALTPCSHYFKPSDSRTFQPLLDLQNFSRGACPLGREARLNDNFPGILNRNISLQQSSVYGLR